MPEPQPARGAAHVLTCLVLLACLPIISNSQVPSRW